MRGSFLLPFALAAVALAGCASTGGSERGTVLDPELRGMLDLETERPRWNEAGQLEARARIHNRGPDAEHLLVLTQFLDVDGHALEPDAPWENVLVPGYATRDLRKLSLREGAVDYNVQIRRGVSH